MLLLVSSMFFRDRMRSSLVVSSKRRLNASVGSGNLMSVNALLSGSYLAQVMMLRRVWYPTAMVFFSFVSSLDVIIICWGTGAGGGMAAMVAAPPRRESRVR